MRAKRVGATLQRAPSATREAAAGPMGESPPPCVTVVCVRARTCECAHAGAGARAFVSMRASLRPELASAAAAAGRRQRATRANLGAALCGHARWWLGFDTAGRASAVRAATRCCCARARDARRENACAHAMLQRTRRRARARQAGRGTAGAASRRAARRLRRSLHQRDIACLSRETPSPWHQSARIHSARASGRARRDRRRSRRRCYCWARWRRTLQGVPTRSSFRPALRHLRTWRSA